KKYEHYTLMMISRTTNGLLYLNGVLVKELQADKWESIELNKVASPNDLLAVTIYGTRNFEDKEVLIGSKFDIAQSSPGIERGNLVVMRNRVSKPFQNSGVLVFCLVFIYTTILSSSNPKAFGEYFDFKDVLV